MSRILVPPNVLLAVADQFDRASNHLEASKDSLNNQISMLMVLWDGTTRQRFFEDFQRTREEMKLTINHLQVTSQELKNIAYRFMQVDNEDGGLDPRCAAPIEIAGADQGANKDKTWQDELNEFWGGLKSGGKMMADSVGDMVDALVEDPVGTVGGMAYNATIGTLEEVVDTTVWGAKMAFDVGDTRENFNEQVEAEQARMNEMGTSSYIGQQAAMILGGAALHRAGIKKGPNLKPHNDLDGSKKDGLVGKGKTDSDKSVIEKQKWLDSLQNTENFKQGTKENALNHIFDGEILKNGNANGFHYEGMPNSNGKIVGNPDPVNEFGVYQAKVEINDMLKRPKSTFFPKDWTPQQVIDSVNEAFNNKVPVKNNKFIGKTSTGMEIEIIIRNDKIISAYPIY